MRVPVPTRRASWRFPRMGASIAACAAIFTVCFLTRSPGLCTPVSLTALEAQLDHSYGLLAARAGIISASSAESVEQEKSGLKYVAGANLSQRQTSVTNRATNQALYFTPTAGVSVPLYGTKFGEEDAVDRADLARILAEIAYADQKRQYLANLRQSYILLWQSYREASIEQSFLMSQGGSGSPARALVRTGFWTKANYLDFDRQLTQAQSDLSTSRRRISAQFATLSSIVDQPVGQFEPVDPTLASGCSPNLETAVISAIASDPLIAQYDAQIVLAKREFTRVKGSSLDVSALANVGADFNILHNFGYVVEVGVALIWPPHARAEERARYQQITATIEQNALLEQQRRQDLRALTAQVLADVGVARDVRTQAHVDLHSMEETLREAIVRRNTVATGGATGFENVQKARYDLYSAQRAATESEAAVWTKGADLLMLAPQSCAPH